STDLSHIFCLHDSATTSIYTLSLHDALPIYPDVAGRSLVYYWAQLEPKRGVYRWDLIDKDMAPWVAAGKKVILRVATAGWANWRSEEHTSELQSPYDLVCRLLLEKKKRYACD